MIGQVQARGPAKQTTAAGEWEAEPTLGPKATRFLSLTTAAFTPLQGALEMIEEVPRLPNRWTISRDTLLELGFEGCTGVQQHKLKKENILLGPLCSPWCLAPPSRPGSPARSWGKGGKEPQPPLVVNLQVPKA